MSGTHLSAYQSTPRGSTLPGRSYRSESRSGAVNRELDIFLDAPSFMSVHDVRTPISPTTSRRIISPEQNAMDIDDDDSIHDSVGDGYGGYKDEAQDTSESFNGITLVPCVCSSQAVGEYLENVLEIPDAQRLCNYVLELPTTHRMKRIQDCEYDLRRIGNILGNQEYGEDMNLGWVLIGLQFLQAQWSSPASRANWNFEEWLMFKDLHYTELYLPALRALKTSRRRNIAQSSTRSSNRTSNHRTMNEQLALVPLGSQNTLRTPSRTTKGQTSQTPPAYQRTSPTTRTSTAHNITNVQPSRTSYHSTAPNLPDTSYRSKTYNNYRGKTPDSSEQGGEPKFH